ncbi:MAG TPA: hypothetical protein VGI31_09200, partial [Streptosporangiaceae bacterium]
MATRAPRGTVDRPKGGRQGATSGKSASSARSGGQAKRSGATSKSGSRKPAARPKSGPKGSKGRQSASRRDAPPSVSAHPVLILLNWIASAVVGLWMLLAHGLGAAARGIGRSARGLEPAHRRDGIGLTAIGAAIIVASATWWHLDNPVGRLMTAV